MRFVPGGLYKRFSIMSNQTFTEQGWFSSLRIDLLM